MTAKAKFIGDDHRLDYSGIYDLKIEKNKVIISKKQTFLFACPYGSVEAFLKNWKIL